ncbi:MAG TPA: hypothetical protein ENK18_21520 [Deltaproteobacteria bacterium]|nr:hypothetical protein [Deltaproteobacteria bacterium]
MLWILPLLGCGTEPTEPTGAPWIAPDARGPHEVGVTTLEIVDDRGKGLTIEVWYPAEPYEGDEPDPYPEVPITLGAYRFAPAAPGPFPLIAFTHGHIAIRYQSAFLCEHLASHGFVVVAPDHPGDTLLDAREEDLWQIVLERPGDVIASVDAVLALSSEGDSLLGGVTDAETYAVVGHSLGSLDALMLGGGEPDFTAFEAFCVEPANEGYEGCERIADLELTDVSGHEMSDPRAVVTVPMSPGLWYAFGDDGLASVRAPLVVAGVLDEVLDYEDEERPVYDHLGAPKSMAIFERAGHYAWSDICLIIPIWQECGGEADGFIDIERAQQITRGLVTAWIRAELLGEDRAAEWLVDARSDWPEVTWEEEG